MIDHEFEPHPHHDDVCWHWTRLGYHDCGQPRSAHRTAQTPTADATASARLTAEADADGTGSRVEEPERGKPVSILDWPGELARLVERAEKAEAECIALRAQLATLDNRFSCGHRKVDWDNSYGDCIACALKRDAIAYDSLPDNLVACHDRIEQLQTELAAVREAALEEAAKRCEALAGQWEQSYTREASDANRAKQAMRDCAAAIRALAQRKA